MEANYFTILYWFCHTSTWIRHRYTRVPHPAPPPTSLPIPSLWVIPVHQPQASCILHRTWTGDLFLIWYYTWFNAILPNHPTFSLSLERNLKKMCVFIWLCWVLVVAHGLSCPWACGILVAWPEIQPASPAWQGRFLATGPPGKSLERTFDWFKLFRKLDWLLVSS